MNFMNLETGLILVEASILLSFLATFFYLRGKLNPLGTERGKARSPGSGAEPPLDIVRLQELLRETELLSRELSKNLEEKREITKHLLEMLEVKTTRLERLARQEKEEEKIHSKMIRKDETSDSIFEMALAGCGIADIAKRLGRSKEEVQLILDMRKGTPEFSQGCSNL